ncbi:MULTISPECIES: alpha/beta fold hydrolase [Caballeronia]|uniref:Poly(R)-hydroxyalkanoic acid synthase n=1 Tax=Caballeronia zhejiangensis TaxID=871203 RepID=A0A656QF16_9BURK|nr:MULTISPECIES: alpha/beta fold hydrolase [Caballeronia]EKS69605.1 Poly-beta-hydroxybutyrate polymerase [Burkholderia sp. SJ98]KDR27103.1 poly(R)-hydroxyalkanoic acid synthase [Caballeronia zhejiangensis]MDR5791285.1 alpha/beta fold hydrolase [Caballeronia sp. LP003]
MINENEGLTASAADGMLGPNPFVGLRAVDMFAAAGQIGAQAMLHPALLMGQTAALVRDLSSAVNGAHAPSPQQGDKRFADPAWREQPLYRTTLTGYLAWRDALAGFIDRSALDDASKERAQFVMSLLTDALAPTNTLAGNPAALRKLVDTRGASVVAGMRNMLTDTLNNKGMPSQVDKRAFRVGGNLATTPGAVVFRNEVLELIQYAPATPNVRARPQLIVPPQINKFYIFDLSAGKSIVEYLVQSEFQVFAVSWRNPTEAQRDWDMDTYVAALIEAIDAVRDITGHADVNLHGACSGAMTISALLGHLAARGDKTVHAATLMVAVLDSSADSQLGLFTTPEAIEVAKRSSRAKGVLPGEEMGRVFAWMRPNDLVWSFWVNNYLMGEAPPAFDILYWNNDTTRLPAKLHGQLLDIFTRSLLSEPGKLTVLGTPVDLSKVECDTYVMAGVTDHITPWKGVYNTARAFGGKTRYVLSSSGHIQSLINPPGNPKAKFFRNDALPEDADAWFAGARPEADSWWNDWRDWLAQRSGELRPAPRALGNRRHKRLADAPGTYVSEA